MALAIKISPKAFLPRFSDNGCVSIQSFFFFPFVFDYYRFPILGLFLRCTICIRRMLEHRFLKLCAISLSYFYNWIFILMKLLIPLQERVKSVFHAKEFGKIINFKTPEDARVNIINLLRKYITASHFNAMKVGLLKQISFACF